MICFTPRGTKNDQRVRLTPGDSDGDAFGERCCCCSDGSAAGVDANFENEMSLVLVEIQT